MRIELFFIAVGLSMDAFAVSVCKGLSIQGKCQKAGIIVGAWFGCFQSLMPLLGYLCGAGIARYITAISKYVALILLSLIGINMTKPPRYVSRRTCNEYRCVCGRCHFGSFTGTYCPGYFADWMHYLCYFSCWRSHWKYIRQQI